MLRIAFAAGLLLVATACAQLPRAELQAYRDSFQAAQTAATPINADYAVAERAARLVVLRAATIRAEDGTTIHRYSAQDPYFSTFEVADAPAITTIGLPPGAAAVERAFHGIEAYNGTLVALAENRNVDEAKGQLRQIISDVTAVAPVEPGAAAIAGSISDLVVQIFRPAIEADNREEFKRIVLEGYDPMVRLVDLLKAHSEDQYATIIDPLLIRLENGAANRDELIAKINAWQRVFADYVVLLDALKERLAELRDAVAHPRDGSALARASSGAAELRGYAEGLRRSVDQLRALP